MDENRTILGFKAGNSKRGQIVKKLRKNTCNIFQGLHRRVCAKGLNINTITHFMCAKMCASKYYSAFGRLIGNTIPDEGSVWE